jgi:diguanylate cyclase (GGDEF)-like protein
MRGRLRRSPFDDWQAMQDGILDTLARVQAALPGVPLGAALCMLALAGLVLLPLLVIERVRRKAEAPDRRPDLELFRSARRDPLTGLPNRTGFSEAMSRRLQAGTRSALVLIDLDRFKDINAQHGHRLGDEVLVAAASRLRQLMPEVDQLARLGGDEFGLLLDAARGRDDVEGAALNLLRAMLTPFATAAGAIACSASIGMSLMPDHGLDADAVLRAAHAAMHEVKEGGGGAFRFYNPARNAAEKMRQDMKDDLRGAIAAGQIIPFYQPIVDLRSGEMVGLEVLARWDHPTRGLLAPDIFIPMAEELQLAGQISQALMRRVVRDSRDWPDWIYFAINVSPGQLRELITMLRDPPVWSEGGIDPKRLEIEVTESALIDDLDIAREMMALLQARGTRVVLDDFGIGYSNIFHLRELPFDRIKIDKSFVMDSASDPRAEACIRAMLALGASLGIDMVAEGIETTDIARHLEKLGCRYGQGYLYSEPVSANGVYAMMRRLRSANGAASNAITGAMVA